MVEKRNMRIKPKGITARPWKECIVVVRVTLTRGTREEDRSIGNVVGPKDKKNIAKKKKSNEDVLDKT